MPTYYELLQVDRNASDIVIRASYKALLQKYHPDKFEDRARGEQITQLLNRAYTILSDPIRRAEYDASLDGGNTSGPKNSDPPKKPPGQPSPKEPKPSRPIGAGKKLPFLLGSLLWGLAGVISAKLGGIVLCGFVIAAASVWWRLGNQPVWKRTLAASGVVLAGIVTVFILASSIRTAWNPYEARKNPQNSGTSPDFIDPFPSTPMATNEPATVSNQASLPPLPEGYTLVQPQSELIKQPAEGQTNNEQLSDAPNRMTINFSNTKLVSLLNLIAEVADRKILISDALSNDVVTVKVTNVPWNKLLNDLANRYNFTVEDNGVTILINRTQSEQVDSRPSWEQAICPRPYNYVKDRDRCCMNADINEKCVSPRY